jgi:hypothetical protein
MAGVGSGGEERELEAAFSIDSGEEANVVVAVLCQRWH